MAKTPATRIVCNADALSRAADQLLAKGATLSKNQILNTLAAAIAGPGHDWGFLRNAAGGRFSQPGLTPDQAPVPASGSTASVSDVWVLGYDDQAFWAPRSPRVFHSQDAAIEALLAESKEWEHWQYPNDQVIDTLRKTGEFTFGDYGESVAFGAQWDEDPYRIYLYQAKVEGGQSMSGAETKPAPVTNPSIHRPAGQSWDSKIQIPRKTLGFSLYREMLEHRIVVMRQPGAGQGGMSFLMALADTERPARFGTPVPMIYHLPLEQLDRSKGVGNRLLDPGIAIVNGLDEITEPLDCRLLDELKVWVESTADPHSRALVVIMVPHDDEDFTSFFAVFGAIPEICNNVTFAELEGPDKPAPEAAFIARFEPQAWIRDNAVGVDPEGETTWTVFKHEVITKATDNDYLQGSENAPEWVREWSGPFEIHLEPIATKSEN